MTLSGRRTTASAPPAICVFAAGVQGDIGTQVAVAGATTARHASKGWGFRESQQRRPAQPGGRTSDSPCGTCRSGTSGTAGGGRLLRALRPPRAPDRRCEARRHGGLHERRAVRVRGSHGRRMHVRGARAARAGHAAAQRERPGSRDRRAEQQSRARAWLAARVADRRRRARRARAPAGSEPCSRCASPSRTEELVSRVAWRSEVSNRLRSDPGLAHGAERSRGLRAPETHGTLETSSRHARRGRRSHASNRRRAGLRPAQPRGAADSRNPRGAASLVLSRSRRPPSATTLRARCPRSHSLTSAALDPRRSASRPADDRDATRGRVLVEHCEWRRLRLGTCTPALAVAAREAPSLTPRGRARASPLASWSPRSSRWFIDVSRAAARAVIGDAKGRPDIPRLYTRTSLPSGREGDDRPRPARMAEAVVAGGRDAHDQTSVGQWRRSRCSSRGRPAPPRSAGAVGEVRTRADR